MTIEEQISTDSYNEGVNTFLSELLNYAWGNWVDIEVEQLKELAESIKVGDNNDIS